MGLIMTTCMSFLITVINVGFPPNFFNIWLKAFLIGFPIGFPIALIATPIIKKIVDKLTAND